MGSERSPTAPSGRDCMLILGSRCSAKMPYLMLLFTWLSVQNAIIALYCDFLLLLLSCFNRPHNTTIFNPSVVDK